MDVPTALTDLVKEPVGTTAETLSVVTVHDPQWILDAEERPQSWTEQTGKWFSITVIFYCFQLLNHFFLFLCLRLTPHVRGFGVALGEL